MIEFPKLGYSISDNAMAVLKERYLFRSPEGEIIETPAQMFLRVSDYVSSVEKTEALKKKWKKIFYDLMASGDFLPNTPTLLNSHRKNLSVLAGCFVIDVGDSIYGGIDSIFGSIELMALIHKMGGGTGCSFHKLRPQGAKVSSTGHCASGPVSFMRNFDEAIEAIQQGGMRRGAHMSLIRVDHPDIEEFIQCKNQLNQRTKKIMDSIKKVLRLDEGGEFHTVIKRAIIRSQLTNMNISISLTPEFKRALREGKEYDIINPHNNKVVRQEDANRIFKLIVDNAWASGEPGFIDLERINQDNPCPQLGEIYSTNPCGEQPLRPFESCTLGSIAVSRMVEKVDGVLKFDYKKFKERIHQAIRFLDNVLTAQKYPVEEIKTESLRTRKIGLGIMGFADLLMKFGIPYGSQECIDLIHVMMSKFKRETMSISNRLAMEKGNFPAWKKSVYGKEKTPLRNAARTTIAPTGSISGIAGVSFGIEPLYGLSFKRRILQGKEFLEVSDTAMELLKKLKCWNKEVENWILEHGSLKDCESVPKEIRKKFLIAHEIEPEKHVQVQSVFQKYIDNAVSKTINLPNSATVEDVEQIFLRAIDLECKGITVYRDGSRDEQVLTTGKSKQESIREVRKRPRKLNGSTYEKEVGTCGKIFVIINTDDAGYPFEIFIEAGKAGGCMQSQVQAVGRLISMAWRSGLGLETIVKQLKGITCHESKPSIVKEQSFLSCSDAIAQIIEEHFKDNPMVDSEVKDDKPVRRICSYCGGPLVHEGHCATCVACFKSSCG